MSLPGFRINVLHLVLSRVVSGVFHLVIYMWDKVFDKYRKGNVPSGVPY